MIWIDPINHETSCYICQTKVVYSKNTEENVRYAVGSSAQLPVLHSDGIPIPACSNQDDRMEDTCDDDDSTTKPLLENPANQHDVDPSYIPDSNHPHLLSQGDLNDLQRDLCLTKQMSELLASRLQQWKLLECNVTVTSTRNRSEQFANFFDVCEKICYCTDIPGLFAEMKQPFIAQEWRLFIDGSKTSIKAVLLHNGNEKPSIPIAFAIGMKEEFSTMKSILQLIGYDRLKFKIVADLKVIAILMGLQSGYTKYCCYLCLKFY